MKMIRNVKNVNVDIYCGDVTIWTYPPPPHVTISHHFRLSTSPLPQGFPQWGTWGHPPPSYNFFRNPPTKTDALPWMIDYGAMSNILFWAQVGQNIVLGPRPPVILNFPNYLHQKEFLQIFEQNEGLFVKILYGVAELCQINHFRPVCPKTSY